MQNKSFLSREVLAHPLSFISFGVVGLIAVGGFVYYALATRTPNQSWVSPIVRPIVETVTASGTVEPAQNPNLAFQSGGKVAVVNVSVGQTVSQGQRLASLDLSVLSAARAQAVANLNAQKAQLAQLQVGPRTVDVTAKQTTVDQANATLTNLYSSIPANIAQAYDKSFSGVSGATDVLFSQPNTTNPTLAFSTTNSQTAVDATTARTTVNTELATWEHETNTLTNASTPQTIEEALARSITHLSVVRSYCDTLLKALSSATPSGALSQSTLTAAQTSVGGLRDSVNGQILSLQSLQQQLTSSKLAVRSATDALNQVTAGATPEAIAAQQAQVAAAQANVENVDAQIANSTVVAPFTGTVTSVAVKSGQIVGPNTVAVSLTPESTLQVEVYVSEIDMAKLSVGASADVTLDAYGSSRIFPAHIVTIDHSRSTANGTSAYKVTLQFASNDPAIATGMTANASILAASKTGALTLPRSAIIENGTNTFVLVSSGSGTTQRPVTLGIVGTSTVEIVSGVTADDKVLMQTN